MSILGGVLQEADGELSAAEECYKENVKSDPAHAASTKRIISLYKAQGKTAEAVKSGIFISKLYSKTLNLLPTKKV